MAFGLFGRDRGVEGSRLMSTRCTIEWFSEINGSTGRHLPAVHPPAAQPIPRYDCARPRNQLSIWMRRHSVLGLRILLAALVFLGSASMPSYAATQNRDFGLIGELWKSEPKYYEPSDTYFQLVSDSETHPDGIPWMDAAAAASKMTYKGRLGRLAIINDAATYAWILETFNLRSRSHSGNTWIGLRYLCSTLTLIRVTGEEQPRSAFSFWDSPWYRLEGIRCGKTPVPYMGVYINGETNRWRAAGHKKHFIHYIVEYPAE